MAPKNKYGTLYLVPSSLGKAAKAFVPPYVLDILHRLPVMLVERARTTRRFLKAIDPDFDLHAVEMHELNKRTSTGEKQKYLRFLREGKDVGILSEVGSPAIADPGAAMVQKAQQEGIPVVPLIGPSSITLALAASGLNGQKFAFWGYLSRKSNERIRELKRLEKLSRQENQTQLFMEAPYRNKHILEAVTRHLKEDTLFSIAANLTLPDEYIKTQSIKQWKGSGPDLHKQPAIFLLYAGQ